MRLTSCTPAASTLATQPLHTQLHAPHATAPVKWRDRHTLPRSRVSVACRSLSEPATIQSEGGRHGTRLMLMLAQLRTDRAAHRDVAFARGGIPLARRVTSTARAAPPQRAAAGRAPPNHRELITVHTRALAARAQWRPARPRASGRGEKGSGRRASRAAGGAQVLKTSGMEDPSAPASAAELRYSLASCTRRTFSCSITTIWPYASRLS